MAAATATKTSYGFLVTGDTGSVTVTTSKIWVKRFIFIPASNADAVVVTDKDAGSIYKTKGATAGTAYIDDVGGEKGTPYAGLIVSSLSAAGDELHIVVA